MYDVQEETFHTIFMLSFLHYVEDKTPCIMYKTYSAQPLTVHLSSSDVVARGDQLVVDTGDVAADPTHLGWDSGLTLL